MGGDAIAGGAKGMGAFIPLILMFVIFYFLLIRPQQKRAKQHREVLKNLRKGDTVVTSGGIHGRITGLTDTIVTLEIADKVRIKVSRGQIAGLGGGNDKE
ncbi:MAG: preprotein translocase subunit YajC [Deltaproteobacteria bacterium]|jgi:preprotein translocase subunit YajC|nr:MAG: preprotein translocase subunit YajC [Deltaproteobacteria bacterium]